MQTITQIRALLDARGLRPKRKLGQNFLHDQNLLAKLVGTAEVAAGDLVLEIGPGTGTLTETLLEAGAEVIACELDRDLADLIEERFSELTAGAMGRPVASTGLPVEESVDSRGTGKPAAPEDGATGLPMAPRPGSLTLVRGDCLDKGRTLNPAIVDAIAGRPFKLVANLPFQIASPLMGTLLTDHPNCTGQFITIQREVAERLLAVPSTKAYGPLSIIVQAFAEVKKIAILKPTCFWPQPKVDSAMVSLSPSPLGRGERGEGESSESEDLSTPASRRAFARFATEMFMKRRKQLGTIFGRDDSTWETLLPEITPDLRPENLAIGQVIGLWRVMRDNG